MQDAQFEELTPFYVPDSKRISRFTRKPVERPLFPGYMFSRFDLERRGLVLQIPGVIQVLSVAQQPAIIPQSDIEHIRKMLACPSLLRPVAATPNLIPGDRVEVIHGPLTGVCGNVVWYKRTALVVIWIQALHSGVSADVDVGDLMRVGRHARAGSFPSEVRAMEMDTGERRCPARHCPPVEVVVDPSPEMLRRAGL